MSIAICYFGLLRSFEKTHDSHINKIYKILSDNNIEYDIFLHSWKTQNDAQYVWGKLSTQKQNYAIPGPIQKKIISSKFDLQEEFLGQITFSDYYYDNFKKDEWRPELIMNHLCALESMKRVLQLVRESKKKYKYIMLVRPDALINNNIPIVEVCKFIDIESKGICVPKYDSNEGYNDRFAIMNYDYCDFYFQRINEIIKYRKLHGRIVSEKYTKFIIDKYYKLKQIDFKFKLVRP